MKAKARHILVNTEQEANSLISEIENQGDFETLAKQHSLCPSKDRGGDLGVFQPGQMVGPFNDVCFDNTVELGTVNKVQTKFGWHLIEVLDRQA